MNAKHIAFKLAGTVAVVAIAAGVFGNLSARVRHQEVIPQDTQTVAGAVPANRADEPRGIAYSATLQAREANALEAKRKIEEQVESIAKLALAHGGTVTLGDSRYLRSRSARESLPQLDPPFLILQQVDILLPDVVTRARLEAELAQLELASPR